MPQAEPLDQVVPVWLEVLRPGVDAADRKILDGSSVVVDEGELEAVPLTRSSKEMPVLDGLSRKRTGTITVLLCFSSLRIMSFDVVSAMASAFFAHGRIAATLNSWIQMPKLFSK